MIATRVFPYGKFIAWLLHFASFLSAALALANGTFCAMIVYDP